jgi:plasmid stability protein
VKACLRVHAAKNGRSMEAEARALPTAAVCGRRPLRKLGSYIPDQLAEIGGVDLQAARHDEPARAAENSR